MTINLIDAAQYYQQQPHQVEAWDWLQDQTTEDNLATFGDKYRDNEPAVFTPMSSFSTQITPHVSYGEITLQSEARRFAHQYQCNLAAELCEFLELARAEFNFYPIIITSGYRPPAINASVGGASKSEHLYNTPNTGALDFFLDGVSVYTLQTWCDRNWAYSLGYGASKGFIHLGIREGRERIRWNY